MRKRFTVVGLVLAVCLLAGCPGKQTTIDQCIQYRSMFNSTLNSLSTNLATLPQPQQQKYAEMALPFASAGALALDMMDAATANGGQIPANELQKFLKAKNDLIDLVAKIILEKKGGK